ncbi:MAG: response regulator [Thiomargarita sp.]|nr:response regulator [Thiomargarita sp.]
MSQPKILIVDDSQSNLFSLEALITEDIEVQIIEALSGQIALDVLEKEAVDLILLDVQMPEMDGFKTAKKMRELVNSKNTPIVFITAAYNSAEFEAEGFSITKMDYFTKPFDPDKLITLIESHLNLS